MAGAYFNGSMADLSVYQNQLPSAATVGAQYAAETHSAAELTTITSPSGRADLSATYDTANDRVASLIDSNGGTWTYGGPVTSASSSAYTGSVMGSSPAGLLAAQRHLRAARYRPGGLVADEREPAPAGHVLERDPRRGRPGR